MAAQYPGALKSFTNPTSSNTQNSPSHSQQHQDINDEMVAVQTELGLQPKGTYASVRARLDAMVPPGVWFPYGGTAAPTGYLLCDGTAVNRVTYAALFAVIGITYGAGDTSTTFNVPDMRDRFPLGKGTVHTALGSTSGADSVTLVKANIPAHVHTFEAPGNVAGSLSGSGETQNHPTKNTGDGTADGLQVVPDAVSILNKNLVSNYIIKT